jgi:alkanesulfonate monooxygenase SsuD/methylene tetrahydromethanopterin reductase-like flavin-dependent oxidoreductase (luciferase family)
MKIGVLLPTREAVMSGRPDAGAMLELAERAEGAGFDSVWAGDSLLARPRFEPLTLLAGAAARTRRVELGTAVLVAPLRNPVLLAHSAATVDQIAQGRLILGVGFASRGARTEQEFAAAGADYAHRATALREQMEICRLLWSGEEVSYAGRHWKLERATLLPRPHRPGGPPLWVGGSGPTSIRLTARHADGYFPNSGSPELLRESWQGVLREAPAGRKPLLALYATVNVGDDARPLQQELERFVENYYGAPYAAISKRQGCVAGSAETCARWLEPFLAQGVEHLVLRLASADQGAQLQRVARELLPRLRELRP